MDMLHRTVRPMFWAALLFAYAVAIMPQADAPRIASSDKVEHMIAFLTLSLLGRLAYPRTPAIKVGLLLTALGAIIEVTQTIPSLHRDGNVADWLADCAAILAGLAIAALLLSRVRAR